MNDVSDFLDSLEPLDDGIHVVDTGFHRPRFDASYLIVENGRGAFVDTGTNHSVPRLLAAVEAVGLDRGDIDYVIATHVHLDHAGGAGLLMRSLPNATLVAHPRGAKHLVDPVHLVKGATAVYGEAEIARSYGTIVGVDASRVATTTDGSTIELAGRPLRFLDTPGHAMHHHCIWDAKSRGFFTGDTFGLSYREFDTAAGVWAMPTTTPVQFQPDALERSIGRMLAFEPHWLYLTHYGRVGGSVAETARLGALLNEQVRAIVALARAQPPGPGRHDALKQGLERIHVSSLRAHGVELADDVIRDLLALDFELNAQGTGIWLDRVSA